MFNCTKLCVSTLVCVVVFCAAGAAETVFPGADWEEKTPESQGVASSKLNEAVKYLGAKLANNGGVGELVIIRNGYMIHKESNNVYRKHNVWSCTKSFTSTVLGHLIDNGKCTLETRAKDLVPALAELYPNVTLRHFATMTSGYDANDLNSKKDQNGASTTPLLPDPPLFEPGAKFAYWDDAMIMNGYVLTMIMMKQSLPEKNLEDYLKKHIAEPIGIPDLSWQWKLNKSWFDVSNPDSADVRIASSDLQINAVELARFGHLFLNHGNWDGTQVISSDWVNKATRVQVPANTTVGPGSPSRRGVGRYGYNWWVNGKDRNGDRLYPEGTPGMFWASGYNNNRCFVIPEWNMVIVRMGTEGQPRSIRPIYSTFFKMIGEACKLPGIKVKPALHREDMSVNLLSGAYDIQGREISRYRTAKDGRGLEETGRGFAKTYPFRMSNGIYFSSLSQGRGQGGRKFYITMFIRRRK